MHIFEALLLSCVVLGTHGVSITRLSNIYLPNSIEPTVFTYNSNAATSGAFHRTSEYYYIGGSNLISVFDISDINRPNYLYTHKLISGTVGDIEICNNFVAVAFDNTVSPDDGKVIIFRTYNDQTKNMEKVHEITVGTNPRDLDFTKNCQTLIVAVEGTLSTYNNIVYDPEGIVVTVSWTDKDLSKPYQLRITDFTSFNDRADEYISRGVRWVYRGEGAAIQNTFSQDLEPESITLNTDNSVAYISLQENNAIAVMDVLNGTITDLVPLGTKDFINRGLDPSDRDGGVRISPWPLHGMYLPGHLEYVRVGEVDYLVTVNEGAERSFNLPDYPFTWRESRSGQELLQEGFVSGNVSDIIKEFLSNDAELGRIRISTIDGRDSNGVSSLHVYGGRSYSFHSIINGSLSLAFESGESLEQAAGASMPAVFNAEPTLSTLTPVESSDIASAAMGPKPSAAASATVNRETFLFVGAGRPGQVLVYSLPPEGALVPALQTVIYEGGISTVPWAELYQGQQIANLGISQLQIIPANQSPTGNTILVVIGKISGNVAFYDVTNPVTTWEKLTSFFVKNRASSGSVSPGVTVSPGLDPLALAALCMASVAAVLALLGIVLKRKNEGRNKVADSNIQL